MGKGDHGDQECTLWIDKALTLTRVRRIIAERVVDGHVMAETIAPHDAYDGKRCDCTFDKRDEKLKKGK